MAVGAGVFAEAREAAPGWYVFWDAGLAYGSLGWAMSQDAAEALAKRLRSGEHVMAKTSVLDSTAFTP